MIVQVSGETGGDEGLAPTAVVCVVQHKAPDQGQGPQIHLASYITSFL